MAARVPLTGTAGLSGTSPDERTEVRPVLPALGPAYASEAFGTPRTLHHPNPHEPSRPASPTTRPLASGAPRRDRRARLAGRASAASQRRARLPASTTPGGATLHPRTRVGRRPRRRLAADVDRARGDAVASAAPPCEPRRQVSLRAPRRTASPKVRGAPWGAPSGAKKRPRPFTTRLTRRTSLTQESRACAAGGGVGEAPPARVRRPQRTRPRERRAAAGVKGARRTEVGACVAARGSTGGARPAPPRRARHPRPD